MKRGRVWDEEAGLGSGVGRLLGAVTKERLARRCLFDEELIVTHQRHHLSVTVHPVLAEHLLCRDRSCLGDLVEELLHRALLGRHAGLLVVYR